MRMVSAALYAPMTGDSWNDSIRIEGRPEPGAKEDTGAGFVRVMPGFFETIGSSIVLGRPVTERDTAATRPVAVVNQAFAKRFFNGQNPIGQHFGPGKMKYSATYEIVGVIKDIRYMTYEYKKPSRNGSGTTNGSTTNGSTGTILTSADLTHHLAPVTVSDALEASDTDRLDGEGHPLLAPPRPAPRRPGLIPTDIADTIGPVLGKAVADIRAHEDGSRRGGDIEDVHKMRVATRRVLAYLKAARPALDRSATDRIRGDVRELAGTLGVIRDHDVMIDRLHTEAGRLGDPDTGALEHLVSRLESERIAGRDQLGQRIG